MFKDAGFSEIHCSASTLKQVIETPKISMNSASFFDERFEKALEQLVSDIEPMLKRVQLLEQFSMLQAPEDNNVELELLALRQEFTSVNAGGQQQFDALAYSQALRRKLISQEQVSVAALELLDDTAAAEIYTVARHEALPIARSAKRSK